jgi:hypothetical protein
MTQIKEELYDFPLEQQGPPLSKNKFLKLLSEHVYKKPVTINNLNKLDKDLLNQVIENERIYKETLKKSSPKKITPTYGKKRTRKHGKSIQRKKMRTGLAFFEHSKKASPISNLTTSKKPRRKTLKNSKSEKSSSSISRLADNLMNMSI